MYLKQLELIGFKSFADRTRLDFEPGLTAIVGPNGCGKSNLADAVRWVLGEQSAKALRGSKMEDCIFNGADTHKPMGMAEVSMTFANCESILSTEFNEVTVTRRVFRDGEGNYFINKTPCRLKDIQRLFMDTGIGTDSYSILEQGRIDLILSSHPEDRREVFEEASGITKFKADKKEAIRKLEHTETNLLRLADIIREVRRQIISLQRQAGKARRYQTIQEQLRGIDLFATRERLEILDREIAQLESRLASLSEHEEAVRADVEQTEQEATRNRAALSAAEQTIAQAMEASLRARTDLDRARELIQVNEDRIRELQSLSERDRHDAEEGRQRIEQHRAALEGLAVQLNEALAVRDAAEIELRERTAELSAHEDKIAACRRLLHELSEETIDVESRVSRLQNELYDLEAGERTATVRRERLSAEQAELHHTVDLFASRQAEMTESLNALQEEVSGLAARVEERAAGREAGSRRLAETLKTLADLRARLAAREAHEEVRFLSDEPNPDAEETEEKLRKELEEEKE
ncbi:MAG: AAA family ATPase [Verrucomicrobia bacterium]|nr:AAA family ATPase [Verrucomicrobiota bacterium]